MLKDIIVTSFQLIQMNRPDVRDFGHINVRIVEPYKHPGTKVNATANLMPEACSRVAAAMKSYVALAVKYFGSNSISLSLRVLLAFTLVFAWLFLNAHIWSSFSGPPPRKICAAYH